MKKLNKMLLIHWYSYDCEVIEFEDINFLTGKNATGKSVIIDALQLVLLGDTNGNFFNKAANEKSARTLKSYLFGENGDDGGAGYQYLRACTFTSYVVLEFEDTEKHTFFLTGIVCDCFEDLHYDYKWFTADRMSLPPDRFTDPRTKTPLTITQFKTYLKQNAKKNFEIIDTNRRFQEVSLAKYGAVKRKYLVLLKKAVPFTPITDIEKFITESICDVKNNIEVEQMQSDIRQYKSLEADAVRTEARVRDLEEIAKISKDYDTDREHYRYQSFIILRAEKEELLTEEKRLKERSAKLQSDIEAAGKRIETLRAEISRLDEEISSLEEEYLTSDLVKHQKALEKEMKELTEEITALAADLKRALVQIRNYGANWTDQMKKISETGFPADSSEMNLIRDMAGLREEDLPDFNFGSCAEILENLRGRIREFAYDLQKRAQMLEAEIKELDTRIDGLKKGIKPYPVQVTALKRRLESGIFKKYHKAVEVPVFAELLEIRDPEWRDAVEGYLDRQKFNLLVPEEYYKDANRIYNEVKKEENIYDTGLVDVAKLRAEFTKKPMAGSLAEELETEDPNARLYADFLLGNVIKCENVSELNRHRIAITKNVMLYKGYVSRRLNPARYADPFIGRRSLEILLANLTREREAADKEYKAAANHHRLVRNAASQNVMSSFEAEQHSAAVREGERIPGLSEHFNKIKEEYDSLDFTWLDRIKAEIRQKKEVRRRDDEEERSLSEKRAVDVSDLKRLVETELPEKSSEIKNIDGRICSEFDEEWVRNTGEIRFQKEQNDKNRRKLTLLESFMRARNQTLTTMTEHERERRRKRAEYNQEYRMPYDTEREDNSEYDRELHTLADIRLPEYIDQIKEAKEKAYNQFRDDFIAKLKSNIESVREQIEELNNSLKNSVFGTDRYRFTISPRAEYRNYYDMITDPMLMDTGGWNIASSNFNEKYQKEIDSLFKALIINETNVSAERRAEYERSIKKFTDYKTYLVFDLIVTNDQGEEQRLSKTLLRKSGGETQIPFYIALLASFSQVCRIRNKGRNNTIRMIILDEAFSKMDGERIQESIHLLRRFGLQAVFSAPPEKIGDIAGLVDRNIAVYKSGHHSFTRYFDPADIAEVEEELAD